MSGKSGLSGELECIYCKLIEAVKNILTGSEEKTKYLVQNFFQYKTFPSQKVLPNYKKSRFFSKIGVLISFHKINPPPHKNLRVRGETLSSIVFKTTMSCFKSSFFSTQNAWNFMFKSVVFYEVMSRIVYIERVQKCRRANS